MNIQQIVETVIKPITQGVVVTQPIEKLAPTDAVLAFKFIDFIEKQVAGRKKALRDFLLGYAEAQGEVNPKSGSKAVKVEGTTVIKERRRDNNPNADGLKGLLADAGIKLDAAFDEVKVLQVNPTKLQFLVETGKLKKDAVEALYGITFALKVQESKAIKEALADAKAPKLGADEDE